MGRKEQASVVQDQAKESEETWKKHLEVAVLQTEKIQAMEEKLEQELGNIATNSDGSIPGRIPATINTSTNGGRSTTSTVTK